MPEEKKNILKKFISSTIAVYNFLEGKKRRIALFSGVVMSLAKPWTIVHKAAEASMYLFGGADAVNVAKKIIKNKLPGGLADGKD